MIVFLIILLLAVLTLLVLYTNNPLIKKIRGKPFKFPKRRLKVFFLGNHNRKGFLFLFIVYALLIVLSFIFLYPLIFMVLTSFKPVADLANSTSGFLPTRLEFSNYREAFVQLNYLKSLWKTIVVSIIPSLFNVVIGALTAYGFARFRFPLKKLLMGLMLAIFIVPRVLISIPQYAWYSRLKLLGNLLTYILPASTGQGLYFALYFLILYSTFKQIPVQLDESAKIDGASSWQIFTKIMLPLVIPSIITVFLFSVVWYWNDADMASMYLNVAKAGKEAFWVTLPVSLAKYQSMILAETQGGQLTVLYQGIKMAGTLLSIIPLLITYLFLQKFFVEGIENSGITGE